MMIFSTRHALVPLLAAVLLLVAAYRCSHAAAAAVILEDADALALKLALNPNADMAALKKAGSFVREGSDDWEFLPDSVTSFSNLPDRGAAAEEPLSPEIVTPVWDIETDRPIEGDPVKLKAGQLRPYPVAEQEGAGQDESETRYRQRQPTTIALSPRRASGHLPMAQLVRPASQVFLDSHLRGGAAPLAWQIMPQEVPDGRAIDWQQQQQQQQQQLRLPPAMTAESATETAAVREESGQHGSSLQATTCTGKRAIISAGVVGALAMAGLSSTCMETLSDLVYRPQRKFKRTERSASVELGSFMGAKFRAKLALEREEVTEYSSYLKRILAPPKKPEKPWPVDPLLAPPGGSEWYVDE